MGHQFRGGTLKCGRPALFSWMKLEMSRNGSNTQVWLYVVLCWVELFAKFCCYVLSAAALAPLCAVIGVVGPNWWDIKFPALLCLALFIGAATVIYRIASRVHQWRERIKPCPHGVSAGLAGACRECQLPKERKELERKAYLAEQQRKAEIQRQAEALRTQEIQRLSHAWLSSSESYYSMTSREFEDAIAQLFRNLGYQVKQTPYSGDGGKDAILVKDGTKYVVECKRYGEANCIGRPDLQKFFAAMHHEGAVGAFYVNTGKFSPQAIEYAKTWPVTLYDRDTFPSLVTKAYPVPEPARFAKTICLKCGEIVELPVQESKTRLLCPAGHPVESAISLADLGVFTSGVPYCKKCGSPMRIRKGYRGQFWGCSGYPKCRFTKRCQRGRPGIAAKIPSPIEMK